MEKIILGSFVLNPIQIIKKNRIVRSIYDNYRAIKRVYRDNKKKKSMLKKIPTLKPLEPQNEPQYIVSLTSYGERLTTTAPYAIISLFDQSIQPDKIILWVGDNDKEKVGEILGKLEKIGLEIRYYEDIKSYKKLIPSLEAFPEDYIITADDDIYYPHNWCEQLINEQKKHPNKIICHRTREIKVDENCNPLPYSQWSHFIPGNQYSPFSIFPTGVAGNLYPPKSLDKQVVNKELYMKLALNADDIWFWAMALINKKYFGEESPYIVIKDGYSHHLQGVDHTQSHDGTSLTNYNVHEHGNDKQLKAVIEYFPQLKEVLKKITPN